MRAEAAKTAMSEDVPKGKGAGSNIVLDRHLAPEAREAEGVDLPHRPVSAPAR